MCTTSCIWSFTDLPCVLEKRFTLFMQLKLRLMYASARNPDDTGQYSGHILASSPKSDALAVVGLVLKAYRERVS